MGPLATSWLLGLGAAILALTLVWVASLYRRDASIVDIFWGPGFVLLAWLWVGLGQGWTPRRLGIAVLVTLWGLRLAAHIARRARGHGEDYRYREMRERHGTAFGRVSLFTVFWLQAALMALIATPLLQATHAMQPAAPTWIDLAGLLAFAVGFTFETIGDLQLTRFKADPANRGKVMRRGLWRYTRHPNYFGDAVVWWGLFLIAVATEGGLWTIFSPALMTVLLLRVSGVTLLERKLRETKPEYADYAARTNAFVPWFPRR